MATFRKAERKKSKLRLGIAGPAGSGKTYTSLLMAFGIGGRIALIDTENGSGDLYSHLGEYDVCTIEAPYKVEKYLDAIEEAEKQEYDIIIIDSLTHAWAGDGGLLDQQGKIADNSKNSYSAWRTITPKHNQLVEAMLTSKCHIIATMRSKTEYVQEKNDKGKTEVKKIGMAPVQREGMDYEFTVVLDMNIQHNAIASKDRTGVFDGQIFNPNQKTGAALKAWLESGVEPPRQQPKPQEPADTLPDASPKKAVDAATPSEPVENDADLARRKAIWEGYLEVCDNVQPHAKNAILKVTEGRGSKEWTPTDLEALETDLLRRRQDMTTPQLDFGQSVREVDPGIDDLAGEKGIAPDPVVEAALGF